MCSKCPSYKPWWHWRRLFHHRKSCLIVLFTILLLLIAAAILITWAVLHPKTPDFILEDATVFSLNASTYQNLVTSEIQITISSRNPDSNRQGIFYDRLDAYVSFRDQQITLRTSIPPTYEGSGDSDVWSPYLYGVSVPVSSSNALALCTDEGNGLLRLDIKIQGQVTWRLGSFKSGGSIFVNCPIDIITYHNNNNSNYYSNDLGIRKSASVVNNNGGVKYQLMQDCDVNF